MNKTIRWQKTNTVKSFKLRKGFFYLSFVLVAYSGYAQNDKNASTYHRTSRDSARLIDVREKLVQLALQNSQYEIVDRQLNKSVYELEKAKGSWLSPVQVSGNLNEFSIKQNSQVP